MRENNKKIKGFTLVELLVVIAILAILAAVSVVGYLSFTEKAKQSNDETLLAQLNTVLQANEATEKPETMSEVVNQLNEAGFMIDKLTPTSAKNEFAYDQDTNRFVILNNDDLKDKVDRSLWVVIQDDESLNQLKDNYSLYLNYQSKKTELEFNFGLDFADDYYINNLVYNENNNSRDTIIINTNNFRTNLTINEVNGDTIKHYGKIGKIICEKLSFNSYHEYGNAALIELKTGRAVLEKNSIVEILYITSVDSRVELNTSSLVKTAFASSKEIKDIFNDVISLNYDETLTAEENKEIVNNQINNVINSLFSPIRVNGVFYNDLTIAFNAALSHDEATIEILSDIDLGNKEIAPTNIGSNKKIILEGNKHTIKNFKIHGFLNPGSGNGDPDSGSAASYYCGFIGNNFGDITINNLSFDHADVDMKNLAPNATGSSIVSVVVANNNGKVTLNDVNVYNSIVRGYGKVGLLHGFTQSGNFTANHCALENNEVIVEADGTDPEAGMCGVIIGYDGNKLSKTNGIKLINNKIGIDDSVKWDGSEIKKLEDGTVNVKYKDGGIYNIISPTYMRGNPSSLDSESVKFIRYDSDNYGYES